MLLAHWGRFEPVGVQLAGRKAKVQYRFRNGRRVKFSARKIDADGLVMLDEKENRIDVVSAVRFVTARTKDGRFALCCPSTG